MRSWAAGVIQAPHIFKLLEMDRDKVLLCSVGKRKVNCDTCSVYHSTQPQPFMVGQMPFNILIGFSWCNFGLFFVG